jgi:hypothetical protein
MVVVATFAVRRRQIRPPRRLLAFAVASSATLPAAAFPHTHQEAKTREKVPTPPSVLGAMRLRAGGPSPIARGARAMGGVDETASCRCGVDAIWNLYRTRPHGNHRIR